MQRCISLIFLGLLAFTEARPAAAAGSDIPWLGERKIQGPTDGLEPIEDTKGTSAYDFSRSVARVDDAAGPTSSNGYGYCTGALVGDHLFLTNFHCDHICSAMLFRLGFEMATAETGQQVYRCRQLLAKSERLDYALYEAEPAAAGAELPFPVLPLYKGPIADGLPVILPNHPSGRAKEIDRSAECVVSSAAVFHTESGRDTIKHMCDSEGGSSGAPLIDRERGYAVGLHWGGKDEEYNMAIPMPLIVADMQQQLAPETLAKLTIVGAAAAE